MRLWRVERAGLAACPCSAREKGDLITYLDSVEGWPIYHELLQGKPPPAEE